MSLKTLAGILSALLALAVGALGVWTKLEENRITASEAYTNGLTATEHAYRALNERMIGVEARLDVMMHTAMHTVPAPVVAPRVPRGRASSPGVAKDVESLAGYAAKRRAAAPDFRSLVEQKR